MLDNNYYFKRGNTDYGPQPFVVNINRAAKQNKNYRTSLWTGNYLQLTLMNIQDEVGLEIHLENDQFLRIEEGYGLVMMGNTKDNLNYQVKVNKDSAIFIPAGIWHNIINRGKAPLKMYTIYAPPHHPHGTVHRTKQEAEEDEHNK